MADAAVGGPEAPRRAAFARQVRDALAHLHDFPYLQTHALARPPTRAVGAGSGTSGRALHDRLLAAIAAVGPSGDARPAGAARRVHELLRLRYAEGLPIPEVCARLGVGQSEYYREHRRGVDAVVSLLWETLEPVPDGRPGHGRGTGAPRHNLPRQLTSFVGRERELADARRLLRGTRLLTLTGTGGCGKTRLALQLAAELLDDYPDGVWFADLAPLADPALVPQTVAVALGAREEPGRPIRDTLLDRAGTDRLLLILDNCEHLIEACARLADALVRAGPDARVLATSREPLGVAGEVAWRVPSLPAPEPTWLPTDGVDPVAELGRYAAARLFAERAAAALPEFRLTARNAPAVARICTRLDGIPLALELAAARVRVLPVEQIAARLDDRFRLLTGGSRTALPRQQTLAAAVGWSYGLLSEPERRLFDRLSVFSGRFSLEAAERVGADNPVPASGAVGREEVLDLLARLVEKSLVVAEEDRDGAARYRLLETLRQYGRERLVDASGAEAVRARHSGHYLELADRAAREFDGSAMASWIGRLAAELDDLRAALRWAVESGDAGRALGLVGRLSMLWFYRGYSAEGRRWLAELLAMPGATGRTGARAAALNAAAQLARNQRDVPAARAHAGEALAIARDAGDREGAARALVWLGVVALDVGDLAAARAHLEEGHAIEMAPESRLLSLAFLGRLRYAEGDHAAAGALLEEALAITRGSGNLLFLAATLDLLGHVATARGDHAAARAHCAEAMACRLRVEYPVGVAFTLSAFANLAGALGQHARLVRLAAAAAGICEQNGVPPERAEQAGLPRYLPRARAALGAERFAALWAEGRAMTLDRAVAVALRDDGGVLPTRSIASTDRRTTMPIGPRSDGARQGAKGST